MKSSGWTQEMVDALNARRRAGEHVSPADVLKPVPQTLDWSGMPIHAAIKADWTTSELLVEGSLGCGKSTVTMDKELDAIFKYPGIPILACRWTDDATTTKFKPALQQIMYVRGIDYVWDRDERCYRFDNGSRIWCFGLKAVSKAELMNKLRGLGVSRILFDQAEEGERAVSEELRGRLRPDLAATLRGEIYPTQLTFVINPMEESFYLSREFPLDNHIVGRKVFSLSVFDNKFLPQSMIDGLLRQWPATHPKHKTLVLGQRGLNLTGDPVYEELYDRTVHARAIAATGTDLLESYEVGKMNPCWIVAERSYHGSLRLLAGLMGQRMSLEDFLRVVKRYRATWFGDAHFRTCASPIGEKESHQQLRITLLDILRDWQLRPVWRDQANLPDVQLACIEEISGLLRRRTPSGREESLLINTDPERWLVASRDGVRPEPFCEFSFAGGYCWDEEQVSVSHKRIKRVREDDWYSTAQRCVENLVLCFTMHQPTEAERVARRQKQQQTQVTTGRAYADLGPHAWLAL